MYRGWLGVAALAAGLAGGASQAPPADPVKAAYHDYSAALARNDVVAAEAAAANALAASQARDGQGGSTAVLALNLAMARLELHRAKDALAPAGLAVEAAHAGAKGVDELMARLVLAEATLTADPRANETGAVQALHDADKRTDLDEPAYAAAVALARGATETRTHDNEVIGWTAAVLHAAGAPGDTALQRGRALTLEAAALLADKRFRDASPVVVDAVRILVKLAPEQTDDKVTLAETYYADAIALRSFLSLFLPRPSTKEQETRDESQVRQPPPGLPPLCEGAMMPNPLPDYPSRTSRREEIGAVVVRLAVDETGRARSVRVLSTLVAPDFRKAVEDPHIKWRFEAGEAPPVPGCRIASKDRLQSVTFRLAD